MRYRLRACCTPLNVKFSCMVPKQYRSIPKFHLVNLAPHLPKNWLRASILFLGYKRAVERKRWKIVATAFNCLVSLSRESTHLSWREYILKKISFYRVHTAVLNFSQYRTRVYY
jgi:hypothetical protein